MLEASIEEVLGRVLQKLFLGWSALSVIKGALGGAETGRDKYYQAASLPTLQDHKYTQYTYKEKDITYTYKKFLSEKLFFSCTGALSALWRTKSALVMFGRWQLAEFV